MPTVQIRSIQVLRAIAACAVVYVHAYGRLAITWPNTSSLLSESQLQIGHAGVDLFFVLSGFLMAYLHRDLFGRPDAPAEFFSRRVRRIVPIYWLLTAFALLLAIAAPHLFASPRNLEWAWLAGNFLFVPWPDSAGSADKLVLVGWTLDYEMFFYALFACALFFRRGLVMLVALMLAAVAAGLLWHPAHPWAHLVTSPMLLEFLAGIAVAELARHPVRRLAPVLIAAGIAGLAVSTFTHLDRAVEWGAPAALIVLGTLWAGFECRGPVGRMLTVVGDASYSIYLTQLFSLPALAVIARAVGLHLQGDVMACALWVGACGSGVAFWWAVERPITRAISRRGRREPDRAAAALPTAPASPRAG